jgi:acyl-CoA synthetase (NDP forming)
MWTYTLPSARSVEILNEAGYPLFTGALGCARTMRAMADYRALRERLLRSTITTTTQRMAGREKVRAMLAEAGSVLCEYRARLLLSAYGIGDENAGDLVQSPDQAAAAARAIGRPVALKVQSADISHKTEAGAVALNLSGDAVRDAYNRVLAAVKRHSPTARIDGVLVQPMAAPGCEVILGINRDPTWGPLLMVGLGGVLVEAVGDVALATVPLDNAAAHALIARLKGAQVFGPYRGAPADIDALAELMVRLSQFAIDFADDISQIDLNPVLVHASGKGVTVVDALVVKRNVQTERHAAAE